MALCPLLHGFDGSQPGQLRFQIGIDTLVGGDHCLKSDGFTSSQRGPHGDIQVNTGHHGHQYQCKQKQADPLALHPPGGLTNLLDDLSDIIHLILSIKLLTGSYR